MFDSIEDMAETFGYAETIADEEKEEKLKISHSAEEMLHGQDWGHESDFFMDEGIDKDGLPF